MSKEREALERICEIIRQENPAGAAHRIEGYMDAIKEMKDVAVEADGNTRRGAALMAVEHFTGHGREFAKDVSTVIYGIAYEAEEGLAVPEDKHTNISEHEEKQKILDLLLPAVQATRAGADVKSLVIGNLHRSVDIYFRTGAVKPVNVEADSGIAMIIDVCRALM